MQSKLPFILLCVAVAALAVISLTPGGEAAYTSLPMVVLWGAIAVASTTYIIRRRLYRRAATFTLHAALLVILGGALVTWLTGTTYTVHLRTGEGTRIGEHDVELTEFRVEYYPGTQAPADFVSTLIVDGRERQVSMNRTLDVGAYRLFQSAYDPDQKGTVLTVSRDRAGTAVSYAGYGLLAVAMIWCMIRRRKLRRAAMLAALIVPTLAAAAPRTLPADVAGQMGELYLYRSGRIMPLSTLAHDFTLKVAGTTSYKGLTPEQFLSAWLFFYDDWKAEPCIKVKGEGRIALTDFFNSDGTYRFDGQGHAAANEKFSLVSEAATGSMWKIYPVRSGEGYEWLSPVSETAGDIPLDEWHFIRHSLNYLAGLAAEGQWEEFTSAIEKTGTYQRKKAGEVLPSRLRVRCEQLFVTLTSIPWIAIGLLIAAIVSLLYVRRAVVVGVAVAATLWTGLLIALSWIASGEVPLTDGSQTMLCLALLTLIAGLWAGGRNVNIVPLASVVAALALCVALMGHRQPQITQTVPVLRSPLLSLHVLAVTSAYALLALMAMCGGAWLAGRRRLIETARRLLMPAVFLLAAGIFIGAVWANRSWGRYWGWDPKETWALITLLVYCLPLHAESLPAFRRDGVFARYVVFAFVTVLVTYFGVNFFLTGLHSYA